MMLCGDCLDLPKTIAQKSVDLVIADPPYKMTKRGTSCRPDWWRNNMGENLFEFPLPDTSAWMKVAFDLLKDRTHMYVFTNTVSLQDYLNCAESVGFKLQNIISMVKDTGMPNKWYYKQTELVLLFRKGAAKPINDMTCRDHINVVMPKQSTGKLHITQKPIDFIEMLVTNSSLEGETVLDMFAGSGTTGVACVRTNRNFVGVEIDENYFTVASERINNEFTTKEAA